jgi:glycosyltransferase involved in cell wall biosynthesis
LPPLRIVGDGPQADLVRSAAAADPRIEWLGWRTPEEILDIIGAAACLVMPSIWYETFGRTIIEAFAKGTPVVASRIGALAELVDEDRTGLLFEPGNAADLADRAGRLLGDPVVLARMRWAARQEYRAKYTAETNYKKLMAIYEEVRGRRDQLVEPVLFEQESGRGVPVSAGGRWPLKTIERATR